MLCFLFALQAFVYGLVPDFIGSRISLNMMLGARKAALKKLQKKQ